MKSVSSAVQTLLSSADFVRADIYTITLVGGAIYRYSGTDRLINWSGNSYILGPAISFDSIKSSVGPSADTVEVTIYSTPTDELAGAPLLSAIRANALDSASFSIDRVYAPTWEAMATTGPTGVINKFSGCFSSIQTLTRTSAVIEISPWTELLDVQMPTNLYQPSCLHTWGDIGCGLNAETFAIAGAVVGTATDTQISTNLTQAAAYFSLGQITFTSGANSGIQRTIKSSDGSGNLTLVSPLPSAPTAADTFKAYPGDDLSEATCKNKFNNLSHFRGFPFVPPPETAL